ncbi:MAG TPA: metallophosphoesterase [Candidatus Limnocylindria bacterium]|nr:metallophosphoesterase [Candidatus Limnocylindria bacterium]
MKLCRRAWASIALVVLASFGFAVAADGATLVPRYSAWKYRDTPVALPSTWIQSGYNDSSWPSGPGVLGYGDGFIVTTVPWGPDANNKYRTTYFRLSFVLGVSPASIQGLTLGANYDDGFVLYLNGQEVARRSLPAGPIDYSTFATTHEGGSYEAIDLAAAIGLLVQGTNQLAIEVHQTNPTSPDLAMDLELSYTTTPGITRGPYLQTGSHNQVKVRWRTNVATDGRVRYGLTAGNLNLTASNATATIEHELALTGLAPNTTYYYSIGTIAQTLAGDVTYRFVTAPAPATHKPTRIWVIGDSGTGSGAAAAVRDAYSAYTGVRSTDLWLMLGDNAYQTGTDAQYQTGVFDMYPVILRQSVLWPTRGNHDQIHAGPDNDYYDLFTLPTAGQAGGLASGSEAYYSFDYGNIHFICLDSEGTSRTVGGAMAQWLRNDLAATPRDWVIAYWHHPPYSRGSHDSDDSLDSGGRLKDMRMNFLPILDSAGVDLVLTGHSHSYERSFLVNGHYGVSSTLTSAMIRDGGDGRPAGDGAYAKATLGTGPNEGAIYAVAGSSAQVGGGTLNHPVNVISLNELGSMVLDVNGSRMDARFLSSTGQVRDSFTIIKGAPVAVEPRGSESALSLLSSEPNPFALETRISFRLSAPGPARLQVLDALGRRVRTLAEGPRTAGRHDLTWDGRDDRGEPLGAGVYFAVLETPTGTWARRMVRIR